MATSQRILSGSLVRGSSVTGSIDRFRQGVSVLSNRQLLMGSTPKMRAGSNPVKLINGRLISNDDQYFNEDIQPPALKTIVGSIKSTNSLNSAVGRISFVPNQEIDVRDFGIPKKFNDGVPFEDLDRFDPVGYMHLSGSGVDDSLMFPRVLSNVSLRDPHQSNGAIEPLTIRDGISLTSTYSPFEAHNIYGFWCNGAETSRRRSTSIVQEIDIELPDPRARTAVEPFEDGGAGYMGSKFTSAVNIPGYLNNSPSVFSPWKESSDRELACAALLFVVRDGVLPTTSGFGVYSLNAVLDRAIYDILLEFSGSINDVNDRHHKSAGAGFVYRNAPGGTDSLAFGGLLK